MIQSQSGDIVYTPANDQPHIIAVAGVGYVGFSIAVLLSQFYEVIAVTTTPSKAESINRFHSPIRDSMIEQFLSEAVTGKRNLLLSATTDGFSAYAKADLIIIAVPTDYNTETNCFDCSVVDTVLQQIRTASIHREKKPIVVIKSTVPVGYTQSIRQTMEIKHLLFCPEFLRESKALYDNLYPSRIIIGCDENSREAAEIFAELLQQCSQTKRTPVLLTGYSEAEAVKLFVNTFLALRVSFFNELDTYAECRGLNTSEIISGVCLDPRIGEYYNNPSFGYGGYCLPKDTRQLLANFRDTPENLIRAVIDSNSTRKKFIAERILKLVESTVSNLDKTVGVYRLTMKNDSDNFRNSAILDVIEHLGNRGANLIIYEPLLEDGSLFYGNRIVNDLAYFKEISTCIIANRYDPDLGDVMDKVYTRDLFGRD